MASRPHDWPDGNDFANEGKLSRSKKTMVKSTTSNTKNVETKSDSDDDNVYQTLNRGRDNKLAHQFVTDKKSERKKGRMVLIEEEEEEEKNQEEKVKLTIDIQAETLGEKITKPSSKNTPSTKGNAHSSKESVDSSPKQAHTSIPSLTSIDVASTKPDKKFSYREYLMKKSAPPIAPGSKPLPHGAPECLSGLTFVFTGELDSLSREDAQDLVKRHGGKVTSAPSGRTSYVVVGRDAGPSKLEKINTLGLKTLDEDGLFSLIESTSSTILSGNKMAELVVDTTSISASPKKGKRTPIINVSAPVSPKKAKKPIITFSESNTSTNTQLWTEKYSPKNESELIGNHSNYEKLRDWLFNWPTIGQQSKTERAVLISGPPGIGKTTAALMACRELGLEYLEMNASDARSKRALHEQILESLQSKTITSKKNNNKLHVLIMDEVDGMSAGDRGGMAELIQLIKKTRTPIICICNDRSNPKIRSLANYCLDLRFRRPDARMIAPRIQAIAEAEGLKLGLNVVDELVANTQGDIRQILNLLSTYRLSGESRLDFDESKRIGTNAKKDINIGPFDAVPALLGTSYDRMHGLVERIEQYFVDNSIVPLMIQENYLRCKPNTARSIMGKTEGNTFVDLIAIAADSISEADSVDFFIRGANQEWSLTPFHAVMSTVRPAYYCHGSMSGRIDFATWLGQNSKGGKLGKLLNEITRHCFRHTALDHTEMRLVMLPFLAKELLFPLITKGIDGIDDCITLMDEYSLCREDFESILELSLEPKWNLSTYTKQLPTIVKSAFTRKYNQRIHQLPYAIGGETAPAIVVKRLSPEDMSHGLMADDGEEEKEEEEEEDIVDDDGTEHDENEKGALSNNIQSDLSKDKMIKVKVTTGSSATKNAASVSSRDRGKK